MNPRSSPNGQILPLSGTSVFTLIYLLFYIPMRVLSLSSIQKDIRSYNTNITHDLYERIPWNRGMKNNGAYTVPRDPRTGVPMKRSRDLVAERRDAIMVLVEQRGEVAVSELAERFEVSPLTIRRDLSYLEEQRVVVRQHGKAVLDNPLGRPSGTRRVRSIRTIATEAASLVEDGDCIFINASSTALAIVEHIRAQDVTVVTNNGKALFLASSPHVSLLLTGGEIRPPKASMTGEDALRCIERVTATKCFLGTSGFSPIHGLTSATAPEPAVNAAMLDHALTRVVVADSEKIGRTSSFHWGDPGDIDLLITDTGATDEQLQALERHGLRSAVRCDPAGELAAERLF